MSQYIALPIPKTLQFNPITANITAHTEKIKSHYLKWWNWGPPKMIIYSSVKKIGHSQSKHSRQFRKLGRLF